MCPAYRQPGDPLEFVIERSKVWQSLFVQLACGNGVGIYLSIKFGIANTGDQANGIQSIHTTTVLLCTIVRCISLEDGKRQLTEDTCRGIFGLGINRPTALKDTQSIRHQIDDAVR